MPCELKMRLDNAKVHDQESCMSSLTRLLNSPRREFPLESPTRSQKMNIFIATEFQ